MVACFLAVIVKKTLCCQRSSPTTRMPDELGSGVVEKSAAPRDSEDLFSMLRTRWNDGVFSDIKVRSQSLDVLVVIQL